MASVRSLTKRLVERSAVALGGPAVLRAARRGTDVVVAYHNVVPDGASPGGDRSLHLPRSDFARQLDLLATTHDVVGLEELIRGETERGRPRAAITIDDGYRGVLTVGLEALAEHCMPSTVFVPPGLLGADALWWDALTPEGASGPPPAFREEALSRCMGRSEEVFRRAEEQGLRPRPQPAHAGLVDAGELAEVVGRAGVTVGAHGWTHADLTALDGEELRRELSAPLAWLRDRFPDAFVPWLSLPYGRWNDAVVSAAVAAGFRGVLDLSGALVDRSAETFPRRVPRKNVPAGISPEGFRLRVAGL